MSLKKLSTQSVDNFVDNTAYNQHNIKHLSHTTLLSIF